MIATYNGIVRPHCTQTPTTPTPRRAMLQMALRQFWRSIPLARSCHSR